MNCECPVTELEAYYTVEAAGPFRKTRLLYLTCKLCQRRWYQKSITAKGVALMDLNTPSPHERQEAPAAAPFREAWQAAGGGQTERVASSMLRFLSKLASGKRYLHIGSGCTLLALDAGGDRHDAVVCSGTIGLVELQRVETHDYAWRPTYGTLYDGIVVTEPLLPEWLECVPKYLAPGGSAFLVADAVQHAAALRAVWGYEQFPISQGTAAESFRLGPPDVPLGEGCGTELVENLKTMGLPTCQLCIELARRMNAWGPAVCRERLADIVEEILPRARDWWSATDTRQKTFAWWQGHSGLLERAVALAGGAAMIWTEVDDMLRGQIAAQIERAIVAAESKA